MPSAPAVRRTFGKKKNSGLTHKEVMQRRHDRRKKKDKRSIREKKKDLVREYMALSESEATTDHKSVARSIMETVEDIKDSGRMNDNAYLQIMDQLMTLNSGRETQREEEVNRRNVITRDRYHNGNIFSNIININDNLDNGVNADYIIDRVGNYRNIYRDIYNTYRVQTDIYQYFNR
jgi:hypothetical protein